MTAALVSGTLFRAPEPRVSKAGKSFVSATLRVKNNDSSQFWSLLAFSEEPKAELMRLGNGDAIAAQGTLKVENSERDGATRLNLTLFVDLVLALRQERERDAKPPPPDTRTRAERCAGVPDAELNDDVPW